MPLVMSDSPPSTHLKRRMSSTFFPTTLITPPVTRTTLRSSPSSSVRTSALMDPERLTRWSQFHDLTAHGIRTLHHWRPQDGMEVGLSLPVHQHSVPTLVACLAGQMRVEGREVLDLQAGDFLLIEPGCWHRHLPYKAGVVRFALGFMAGRCDMMLGDHQGILWGAVDEQPYRRLIDELMDETRVAERLRLVDELIASLAREQVIKVDWIEPGVHKMAIWLWHHLHERLDSQAIIARGGFSRRTGFRLFKQFFGRSPQQEILAQRLALAQHLLRRGFTLAECARRSGFISAAAASQALRQRRADDRTGSNGT